MKNNVRGLRIISLILIIVMIFAVMPDSVVRADAINIDKESNVWSGDGEGGKNYDIPAGTYGSVVIPATGEGAGAVPYHLTIAGTEVTATSVEIQSGATLHILFDNNESAGRLICDKSDNYYAAGFGTGDGMKFLGDKFVVYKPDFLGVTINDTGETNAPLAWSVESSLSIAETGRNENRNTETDIYFGFSSVEIAPVTASDINGLSVTGIQSVEVLDGIPENAVKIEETGVSGKYAVQLLSDYYDTVRIKVTYGLDNGSTDSGIMTLNRVGIMLQGGRTAGDSHTVNIFHGHEMGATLDAGVYNDYKAKNTDKQHGDYGFAYYATYYYPTSSQAASADVSLFVTYTYADGSVERKLLESDYFTAATGGNVAMSDYILYMGDGSNAPVKVEAIAVPNANPDGTINGAKLGAGKGVGKTLSFND
ncbi:MAG: hypothetical protein ACI4D0_02845 [Lachnospira sp.]